MTAQLRSLLDEAADSRVPADLGERAVADARHRRARRLVVGGSVLAVAAVALGTVLAVQPFRTGAEPRPTDVASLPAELPAAAGLPTLAEAPMDAASAAYVAEGGLVVVSASDGHAAEVAYDLPVGLGVRDVALSPDGRSLLVSRRTAPSDATPLEEPVRLLDVASGTITPVGLKMTYPPHGGAVWSPESGLVAWAPDSSAFACVCSKGAGSPEVWWVTRADLVGSPRWQMKPTALAWGASGLLAQVAANGRRWLPLPGASSGAGAPSLPDPSPHVALSLDASGGYLATGGFWGAVSPDAGGDRRTLVPLEGAVALFTQAVTGGYLVVLNSAPYTPTAGEPLEVRFVRPDGSALPLTRLPAGTWSASFAATLVEGPAASG